MKSFIELVNRRIWLLTHRDEVRKIKKEFYEIWKMTQVLVSFLISKYPDRYRQMRNVQREKSYWFYNPTINRFIDILISEYYVNIHVDYLSPTRNKVFIELEDLPKDEGFIRLEDRQELFRVNYYTQDDYEGRYGKYSIEGWEVKEFLRYKSDISDYPKLKDVTILIDHMDGFKNLPLNGEVRTQNLSRPEKETILDFGSINPSELADWPRGHGPSETQFTRDVWGMYNIFKTDDSPCAIPIIM